MYRQRLQAIAKTLILTSYATQKDFIDHMKGLPLYQQQSRVPRFRINKRKPCLTERHFLYVRL